jgi:uncharacterized protein YecT (DUF1311 family)
MLKIDRRVALGEVVVRRLEATTQESLMRVWKLALLPAALLAATLADPVRAETVDWYDADYQQCAERTTRGIVECVAARTQAWDRRLNAAYRALMNLTDERRTALRDAQRLWIRYRDANCGFYATGEGTLRQIEAAECLRVMTAWRALELEALSRTPER